MDSKFILTKFASINAGISSAILLLDWSQDSETVVINSQDYFLSWINIDSKKRIMASGAKDI
jgi:hypothetical protein